MTLTNLVIFEAAELNATRENLIARWKEFSAEKGGLFRAKLHYANRIRVLSEDELEYWVGQCGTLPPQNQTGNPPCRASR
jgi:hypothetical protein